MAPQDIYEFPASRFVAEFIGSINLFEGQIAATGQVFVGFIAPGLEQPLTAATDLALPPGTGVLAAIRPEKITLSPKGAQGNNIFPGVVEELAYMGMDSLYRVRLHTPAPVLANIPNAARGKQ